MRRSITVRAARKRRRGVIDIRVLFDTRRFPQLIKTTKTGRAYFYPAVVEYGSARRNVPPRPFMRPAWEARKHLVYALVKRLIRLGIEEEARRGA